MVQIKWTQTARMDLCAIHEYIAKDSKKYAKLEVQKIQSRTQLLKNRPLSGRKVPEINNVDIREIIEGRYRIIYKLIDTHRIDILTIHHAARDLNKINL